jgi:hypothetical protein
VALQVAADGRCLRYADFKVEPLWWRYRPENVLRSPRHFTTFRGRGVDWIEVTASDFPLTHGIFSRAHRLICGIGWRYASATALAARTALDSTRGAGGLAYRFPL